MLLLSPCDLRGYTSKAETAFWRCVCLSVLCKQTAIQGNNSGWGGDPINLKIEVITQCIWELLDIGLFGLHIDLSIGI